MMKKKDWLKRLKLNIENNNNKKNLIRILHISKLLLSFICNVFVVETEITTTPRKMCISYKPYVCLFSYVGKIQSREARHQFYCIFHF